MAVVGARLGHVMGHIGRILDHGQGEGNTDLGCGQPDPDPGQVGVHSVE